MADYPHWRYLAGFVDESEALTYATGQGLDLGADEITRLREDIHNARVAVGKMPSRSDDSPQLRTISGDFRPWLTSLESEPTFKENIQGSTGHEWAEIEVGKVRCFQPNLNLEYIETLIKSVPQSSDREGLVKFCLPLSRERRKVPLPVGYNNATNTYTVVSENLDFRILGNVGGEATDSNGATRPFLGFIFGFGLPQLTVARYRGCYILKNGYHRAYALLMSGHDYAPALVVDASSYQAAGGAGPGFLPPDVVLSEKPPILSDFNGAPAINVSRRRMRVVLSVHAEAQVVGA